MKSVTMMVVRLNRTFKKDTTMTTILNIANELSKKCDLKIIRPTFYKNTPNENILDQIPVSIYDFKHAFEILDKVKPDFILNMSGYEVIGLSFTIAANIKKIPVIKVFDLNPDFMKDWNTFEAFKAKTITAFSKTALEDVTGEKNNLISNFKFLFRKFKFLFNTIKFSNISNFYFFSLILLIFFSLVTKNDMKIQKQFQADLNFCSTQKWIDTLISNGFRKSGLVLTGSCTYDELYSKTQELVFTKEKIKKIIFCPSPMHGYGYWSKDKEDQLIISTVNTILKSGIYDISIKLHPVGHNIEDFRKISKDFLKEVPIYQPENLIDLLISHDLMITSGASGVTLYAHLLKYPVISIITDDSDLKYNPYFSPKLSVRCKNPNEIISSIENYTLLKVVNRDYDLFYKEFLGTFDGRSSERMSSEILKILDTKIRKKSE